MNRDKLRAERDQARKRMLAISDNGTVWHMYRRLVGAANRWDTPVLKEVVLEAEEYIALHERVCELDGMMKRPRWSS